MAAEAIDKLSSVLQFPALVGRLLWVLVQDFLKVLLPNPKKSLKGEVMLITGAGHGMGKQVAIDVARMGAKVVLWDINEAQVKEVAECIVRDGGSATWYVCDVTSEKAVAATAKRVEDEVGAVDVLLNNAGIMQNLPMQQLDSDRIRMTFDVNVLAHFWTIRAFLPSMEKRNNGHIVALASGAGLIGHVNQTDYSASKHAVVGMMEAFTEELRLKGSDIKTTTICPLTVNTGLNNHPCSKYSWVMPIVSADDAARQIVAAIQREDYIVTVPKSTLYSLRLARMFPRRFLTEILDFLDYCRVPNSGGTSQSEVAVDKQKLI